MKFISIVIILSCFGSVSRAQPAWDELFTPEQGRKGLRTDAFLVWHNKELRYERYARDFTAQKKHILWSISKSVTSLLYAVLEHEGAIRREDSICKYIQPKHDSQCEIKMQNVLQWTTGLKWVEEYERSARPRQASILAMLYGEGRHDMAKFVLSHPTEHAPGTAWKYSSGDTILLMRILQNLFPGKDIRDVFLEKLFKPLGISDFTLQEDGVGTAGGAYFFYMRAPDLLKLGVLVMQRGEWQGRQLFHKSWLDFILTVPDAFKTNRLEHDDFNVGGGHFWLNQIAGSGLKQKPWPGAPDDAIMALGHWGQYLVIVPSLKLVALRFGDTRDDSINSRILAEHLMRGFKP